MKYGWLVVNEYLRSKKFGEIYNYLIVAAEKRECVLEKITNQQIMSGLSDLMNKNPEFVIFWDKDVRAARLIEKRNVPVFNSAKAIEICDDKSLTYIALVGEDIKMPRTLVSPLTFGIPDEKNIFLNNAIKQLEFPFIVKENNGSFGAQVYLARNRQEAENIINGIGQKGFILQEYIEASKGRDIRINMVGDKPVTAMLRENPNDFRANITNGGHMKAYEPTEKEIEMAIKVCRKIGLDFAGVDIMFGDNGEPVFCEVNSNAHFKNILECTGINVADYIMEYVIKKVY